MIDPRFLAEVKSRTSIVELVGREVKLKRSGRGLSGLCPFHAERTASFYVSEEYGTFRCYGCGKRGDVVQWVRDMTDAKDFSEAVSYLAQRAGLRSDGPTLNARPIVRRPMAEMKAATDKHRIDGAREIWRRRVAAEGTAAERYLRARRIGIPLPPTIAFIPDLGHPHRPRRAPGMPAMVAPVQAADRSVTAVHCTFLAPDGAGKAARPSDCFTDDWKAKIIRGPYRGGAIRLTPIEDLMVVAEGIETAASVLQALWDWDLKMPVIDGEPVAVWAAGSLDNMGAIELPSGVREVILAGDNDGKVPTADTAHVDPDELLARAAAKHRDAGRNVRIARALRDMDFNDMVPAGTGYVGDRELETV